MTCVVAIKDGDRVYMGADSFYGGDFHHQKTKHPKFFERNGVMIGLAGSPREYNLLQWDLEIPENERDSALEYVVKDIVPGLRSLFRDHGTVREVENQELFNSDLILATKGCLFNIDCDYQVGESSDDYLASGCGKDYALGSLFSSSGSNAEDRLRMALEASAYFSPKVCEPFYYGMI